MSIVMPIGLAKEQRLRVPAIGSGIDCIVISGYASFATSGNEGPVLLMGSDESDYEDVEYDLQMEVGPLWAGVRDVSPIVSLAGFHHKNSDEADSTGYVITDCAWDTVGLPAPDDDKERIRLLVKIFVRGGPHMKVSKFAYHLVANGSLAAGESI